MFEHLRLRLALQKKAGLYRSPPLISSRSHRYVEIGGGRFLNFASNDYLALSSDDRVKRALSMAIGEYGTSSSSSRLVSGHYRIMEEAEASFAHYFGYETALFFQSGFQANLAIASTLAPTFERVFVDKHLHASTVCGLKMGQVGFFTYRHGELGHLRKRMERYRPSSCVIFTESLFSMDGDVLDVEGLLGIKQAWGAACVVDEAHSFGVLGEGGRGIARRVADVALGTLGKAFGFFGAFVLMPRVVKEYLFNFSHPLIYSTALPPAHARAAVEVLERVSEVDERRRYLADLSLYAREMLLTAGLDAGGDAHILWIRIGEEKRLLEVTCALREEGILAFGARYPTVPLKEAILRISLCYFHHQKDIKRLVEALKGILRP